MALSVWQHVRAEWRVCAKIVARWWKYAFLASAAGAILVLLAAMISQARSAGLVEWLVWFASATVMGLVWSTLAATLVAAVRGVFHFTGLWLVATAVVWAGVFVGLCLLLQDVPMLGMHLGDLVAGGGGGKDWVSGGLYFVLALGGVLLGFLLLLALSALVATLLSAPLLVYGIGRRARLRAVAREREPIAAPERS